MQPPLRQLTEIQKKPFRRRQTLILEKSLVRIRIPHTGDDDGDVFVSVNDRNWYIKRGSEVEIPECAAEVLIRREERIADAIDYENRLAANRRK